MATDYDAPRKRDDAPDEDSIKELTARRTKTAVGLPDRAALRRPLRRGAGSQGTAAPGRRVHLHQLPSDPAPQSAGAPHAPRVDLPRLRLSFDIDPKSPQPRTRTRALPAPTWLAPNPVASGAFANKGASSPQTPAA